MYRTYDEALRVAAKRNRLSHCGCTTWYAYRNADGTYSVAALC